MLMCTGLNKEHNTSCRLLGKHGHLTLYTNELKHTNTLLLGMNSSPMPSKLQLFMHNMGIYNTKIMFKT